MPKGYLRLTCRICDRPVSECGSLSKRGKCSECANAMVAANITHLSEHGGVFFDHWRRRSAAAYGAVLLDDLKAS